jgi:DNA-directed RNA polymerase specialized sigma24 family protein
MWLSPEVFTDPADLVDRVRFSDEVTATLGRLTQSQRRVLLLCAVDGLSTEEAAQAMGLTVQAAISLLKRAKSTFRRAHSPQDRDPKRNGSTSRSPN